MDSFIVFVLLRVILSISSGYFGHILLIFIVEEQASPNRHNGLFILLATISCCHSHRRYTCPDPVCIGCSLVRAVRDPAAIWILSRKELRNRRGYGCKLVRLGSNQQQPKFQKQQRRLASLSRKAWRILIPVLLRKVSGNMVNIPNRISF